MVYVRVPTSAAYYPQDNSGHFVIFHSYLMYEISQNQIKRTLSRAASIEYLTNLLKDKTISHRTEVTELVCKHFNFYDARNQMQLSGCLKALRTLESKGHFTLPEAQGTYEKKPPQRLENPVPLPVNVPLKVGELQELKLIQVQSLLASSSDQRQLSIHKISSSSGDTHGKFYRSGVRSTKSHPPEIAGLP